ncbi:ABC transporter ATP-binding protein [Bogoriella caseilytica]|uniref:Peptide/nickel transport system ATP-binding protein n=1 Tax=Bogoriella caseilytica TaxID=56055 RepID=A0A3N2BD10_9MICO|nr:ABC transporter ATP-binding protein [Bogoriella caseilytica]ROR73143.1 peptide/nickel transport system ATP-binding protein [Bogoriella caseilytica]
MTDIATDGSRSRVQRGDETLSVKDLRVHLPTENGTLKAVEGVTFTLRAGRTLGLVGESGSGKSMTAKTLLRLNPKQFVESGEANLAGHGEDDELELLSLPVDGPVIRSVRGRRVAMIFQEPMTAFSPLYTIGNQIMEAVLLHRTDDPKEARRISIEMMDKVGIADAERRFDQYPHEFSGGMRQRAMIATALSCNPEVLIADEPTTALDVTIQSQVLELMRQLQEDLGMAILFITHDLAVVAEMCDEVAVMYLGKIVEHAPVREVFRNPQHPYTRGLLNSIPKLGRGRSERLEVIPGVVPQAIDMPPMCGFYGRCSERLDDVCGTANPVMTELTETHVVRCFLHEPDRVEQLRGAAGSGPHEPREESA